MATMPSPAEIEYQMEHISDNKGPEIIAANVICFTIACIAVALRFQSRRVARIKYEADDWLIITGLFFTSGVILCALLGVHYGSGRHAILLKDPAPLAKLLLSGEVIWGFAITTIKCSILYLYYRVFYINRGFVIILKAVGIFVALYCIVQCFASLFQCTPIDSQWIIGKKHHCVNTDLGATIIAAFNVLSDFIVLVLPMPLLYQLQKPLKQKLEIMAVFSLGGLVCFASLYRCILTREFSRTDPSWSDARPEIWTIVELCMGIVSACLPTLRPLFTRTSNTQGSGAVISQEKSGPSANPDRSLSTKGSSKSLPSESQHFAHLGVLSDVEFARHDMRPQVW